MDWFRRFSVHVANAVGSHYAFFIALAVVVAWGLTGPLFHYSDTWQLVINTATTVVTFLMVFLIQAQQNRDGRALHLKLDELIRAQKNARNTFADLEDADEEELLRFTEEFKQLRKRGVSREEALGQAAGRSDRMAASRSDRAAAGRSDRAER